MTEDIALQLAVFLASPFVLVLTLELILHTCNSVVDAIIDRYTYGR